MTQLEERKLQAEIRSIEAATTKAEAETIKAKADAKSNEKTFGYWLVEAVKVIGAIVIGIGGFIAAFTGYQLSEVKKERADLDTHLLQMQVQETLKSLEATKQKKDEMDSAVARAQAELDQTRKQIGELQPQLAAIKKSAAANDTTTIDAAIAQTNQIQATLNKADKQLETAKTVDTDREANKRLHEAVEELFSNQSARRVAAYNKLSGEFRQDPEAVIVLLNFARDHMDNEPGIYNTVVTLKDMSRTVTQPRKQEINEFCNEAEKLGPRTKKQIDALRKWLETKR